MTEAVPVLRLANISLGIAAVPATLMLFPSVPSLWDLLIAPHVLFTEVRDLPAATYALAALGVNWLLPAALLMVGFAIAGLTLPARERLSWVVPGSLAAVWILHCIVMLYAAGLERGFGQSGLLGIVTIFLGFFFYSVFGYFVIIGAAIAVVEARHLQRATNRALPQGLMLLGLAVMLPAVSLMPAFSGPSNVLASSADVTRRFEHLCESAGVELKARPSEPARSAAFDPDSKLHWGDYNVVEIGADGRIRSGGWMETYTQGWDELPEGVIPTLDLRLHNQSPDVLVFFAVDDPQAARRIPERRGPVQYRVSLRDTRSGVELAEYRFVIDSGNGRACGTNVDNWISLFAFIHGAMNR